MQAVILAGGLGTRLRSLVNDRPKPLADVAGKPFLEYQIEFLKRHRLVDLILCVGYSHGHIQAHFRDGGDWGVKIQYSIEAQLLGTAGALKLAERYVTGTFLVLNGDSYFDIDLGDLIQFHRGKKAGNGGGVGTIALTEVVDARQYGAIKTNQENKIESFLEKSIEAGSKQINAGIYVLEPEVLAHIPPLRKISLERETFPTVLANGQRVFGYLSRGFFVDIGTPAGYHRFVNYINEGNHDYPQQSSSAN